MVIYSIMPKLGLVYGSLQHVLIKVMLPVNVFPLLFDSCLEYVPRPMSFNNTCTYIFIDIGVIPKSFMGSIFLFISSHLTHL